jgi:predicted peptidase
MSTYPYLIQLPDAYHAEPDQRWPLILFLHGSGERGDSLPKINAQGLPKLIAAGKTFPAIVISPQCPEKQGWEPPVLSQLLDDVSAKYRIDPDRIAVTGISMGGYGAWALALAYPDRFSALVPICGGGNPAHAAKLKRLPIWVFHGGKDNAVPVKLSHDMVDALRKSGGRPHFTLYANAGHDSWTPAYDTAALYPWLLAQKRGEAEKITPDLPAD